MGLVGNKVECLCRISKIRKSTANIGTCSSGRNDLFTSGRIEEWKIIVAAAASAPPSSPPKSKKGVALWLARYAHNRKGVYHGVEVAKKVVCEVDFGREKSPAFLVCATIVQRLEPANLATH